MKDEAWFTFGDATHALHLSNLLGGALGDTLPLDCPVSKAKLQDSAPGCYFQRTRIYSVVREAGNPTRRTTSESKTRSTLRKSRRYELVTVFVVFLHSTAAV